MEDSNKLIFYSLLLLLILNLVMKFWDIGNVSSGDEYIEVIEALRVDSGQLNLDRLGKRVYLYILSVEYALYYLFGWALGLFESPIDFATKVARDMQPLLLLGRSTSVILSTITVWLTYKTGEKIHSPLVGLLAAVFLSSTTLVLELSKYARVDATLGFLIASSMYFIIRIAQAESPNLKVYAWAGLFAALAFQCKPQGIVLLVPAAIAHFMRREEDSSIIKHSTGPSVKIFLSLFALGIVLGNPAVLVDPQKYLTHLIDLRTVYTQPMNVFSYNQLGYISYITFFLRGMGIPLFMVTISSVIWMTLFSLRRVEHILLLAFIGAFYLVLGGSKHNVMPDYMLPIYPYIYIVAAIFLCTMTNLVLKDRRKAKLTLSLFCLLLLVYPATRTMTYLVSVTYPNTRILAKEWIETNIPPHSKILMDTGRSINSIGPLIAADEKSLKTTISQLKDRISAKEVNTRLVSEDGAILYRLLLKTVPSISYNIQTTGRGLFLKDLDYYREQGFEYVIVSDAVSAPFLSHAGRKIRPQSTNFYARVRKELCLLKRIEPPVINRGNDTFYIYAFNNNC